MLGKTISTCTFLAVTFAMHSGIASAQADESGPTTAIAETPEDTTDTSTPAEWITPEAQQAAQRGLAYLAERQLDNGSFGTSGYQQNVAVCGLAGMAFLASGSTPGRGPYGQEIDRCIEYLLSNTSESGFISFPDATSRGPMYGHGFSVLFLSEACGMSRRNDLRPKLKQAVQLILDSQNHEGGWRYQPHSQDADISVTVCEIMALRAARNAGIAVPKETMDRAIDYVKQCQNPDGGFRYMRPGSTGASSAAPSRFARSAAAVVAFYNVGIYESPELTRGLDYISQFRPSQENSQRAAYYFYGHYYAVQAMWHASGERWETWYPAVRETLVNQQRTSGSWMDPICPEYGTAMACIILQVPNNCLPILQR